MGRMPHVYLIRHGQTEWSVNGRHTGTSDIPLTAKGVETMERTAKLVVPDVIDPEKVSHFFISPRQRAQKTAQLLFNPENKSPSPYKFEITPEVSEWDYGAYEGLVTADIKKIKPDWWIWTDGCPPSEEHPGGESPEQMEKRVDKVIAMVKDAQRKDCEEGKEARDIVIVSHGHFSRCFIVRWCGWSLQSGYHISSDAGALSILGYQHHNLDEPSLIALNWFSADRTN